MEDRCKLIRYVPLNDTQEIDITFSLKPQRENYKVKACHYLGWLIGHEGEG